MPETVQLTVCPTATALPATQALLAGLIVQLPTLTPAGKPLVIVQVVAPLAAAVPALLQVKLPE